MLRTLLAAVITVAGSSLSSQVLAVDSLSCDLSGYRSSAGLSAAFANNVLTATWSADNGRELQFQFAVEGGRPIIEEISARDKIGQWIPIARHLIPEFRIVSGRRRITNQQLMPLRNLGQTITQEIVDKDKWEAFWDAPLRIGPDSLTDRHLGTMPPKDGILNQPGLPRAAAEVGRASANYDVKNCGVKTDGARLEIIFPGARLGVFAGSLQYTFYKGTSLVKQEILARTEEPSVAYKYDAGLSGISPANLNKVVWRDIGSSWQHDSFGGESNTSPVPVQSKNRLIAAEGQSGSIAAFPPPHNFFWAREIDTNLGYSWYQKDSPSAFSFGIRQAESESDPGQAGRGPDDTRENFALYSAPPGSLQRMSVYFLIGSGSASTTIDRALSYTRGDHYKALSGYQVMLAHVHGYFVRRIREHGLSVDAEPADFPAVRAAGVNIFAPIDGGAGGISHPPTPDAYVDNLSTYYQIAERHSDKDFVVMPNVEITEGELPELVKALGGHWELMMPRPVFYSQGRAPGQPLVETDAQHRNIYRLGSAADVEEMMHREGIIAYMPHPRSKGSTGYPDAIKDTDRFRDQSFRGIGYRWGMGLDRSEIRLCDERCLTTLDDMNNWVADLPTPPKYLEAISEFYAQSPGDDIYGNTPVNYLQLQELPKPGNWAPIVDVLRHGKYFVTSGEVLITNYAVQGSGRARRITADLEWTFPLDFVEIVWGDGHSTGRQIISTTDLPAFGKKHFDIPFDPTGKKWVRFAAWDTAGEGALVQPVKLVNQ